jgi:hypothetical protein
LEDHQEETLGLSVPDAFLLESVQILVALSGSQQCFAVFMVSSLPPQESQDEVQPQLEKIDFQLSTISTVSPAQWAHLLKI